MTISEFETVVGGGGGGGAAFDTSALTDMSDELTAWIGAGLPPGDPDSASMHMGASELVLRVATDIDLEAVPPAVTFQENAKISLPGAVMTMVGPALDQKVAKSGGTMTGDLTANNVVLPVNRSVSWDTDSTLPHAPWTVFATNSAIDDHDHVHVHGYNITVDPDSGAWTRTTDGEHAVRVGYESRYTAGDPSSVRGAFEFNIDIDPTTTGALSWSKRPFFVTYDMDNSRTAFSVGDPADTSTCYFSIGMSGSYSAVLSGRGDLPLLCLGQGTPADVSDPTKTGRLCVTANVYPPPTDKAAVIRLGGAVGESLVIDPGLNASSAVGGIYLGVTRPSTVFFGGAVSLADSVNIIAGTTTGSQIGTATTQKLGFWGATPVAKPADWATPSGTLARTTFASDSASLNDVAQRLAALITDLRTLGLI